MCDINSIHYTHARKANPSVLTWRRSKLIKSTGKWLCQPCYTDKLSYSRLPLDNLYSCSYMLVVGIDVPCHFLLHASNSCGPTDPHHSPPTQTRGTPAGLRVFQLSHHYQQQVVLLNSLRHEQDGLLPLSFSGTNSRRASAAEVTSTTIHIHALGTSPVHFKLLGNPAPIIGSASTALSLLANCGSAPSSPSEWDLHNNFPPHRVVVPRIDDSSLKNPLPSIIFQMLSLLLTALQHFLCMQHKQQWFHFHRRCSMVADMLHAHAAPYMTLLLGFKVVAVDVPSTSVALSNRETFPDCDRVTSITLRTPIWMRNMKWRHKSIDALEDEKANVNDKLGKTVRNKKLLDTQILLRVEKPAILILWKSGG
ncbi:hypothetical protein FB451DRAFT_1196218 [Mycena latifolia]|nr:hypothetical protein FB451DRAFT_1196218 [Mycena latifolia]